MASPCNGDGRCLSSGRKWVSVCYSDRFYTMHFPPNSIIFINNHNQLVAGHSFLFAVRFPACFGQIYWPSSGSDIQRCSNLELSHVRATVFVLANIKIIKVGFQLIYSWNMNNIRLRMM